MRICFVSRRFFPAISGMSVYALNLLRELSATGYEVTMLSQYRGDDAGTRIYGGGPPPPVDGVRVVGVEARGEQDGGDFERDVLALADAVVAEHERTPFDVLHAQYGYPPGLAVLEAGRRLGLPSVVSIQGGDGHWVGACCATHHAAMRTVLDHANAVLIGSASFRDEVVDRLDCDPSRFTIVPGGVDVRRFVPSSRRDTDGALTFVYHGRVDRRKGVLDLLEAIRDLDDVRLLVSGIGPDLDAAAELASGLAHVELTGYATYEDVPAILRRGDAFVSPTYAEGFSNTILEAMASGLPIISTRSVGVVDCLRDEDNALLVEPGDVEGLRGALVRLRDDAALRARLAAAALIEVRERYAWTTVAGQITDVYRQVAGAAPANDWMLPRRAGVCHFRSAPHLL
ncbi:MAG: glycogen synthase [Gaiellales bacterium]|nr:glycogen synthase [Gaiellales bacterium]